VDAALENARDDLAWFERTGDVQGDLDQFLEFLVGLGWRLLSS
jgi:hypothetical protein